MKKKQTGPIAGANQLDDAVKIRRDDLVIPTAEPSRGDPPDLPRDPPKTDPEPPVGEDGVDPDRDRDEDDDRDKDNDVDQNPTTDTPAGNEFPR